MSRAGRLLDLVEILRRHRRPTSGAAIAAELGVSLRTVYRDVAVLQGQGAPIEGEAGVGYVLGAGWMLPPLMFGEEEIEALVLGSRWVAQTADPRLAAAARQALARIAAVMPERLGERFDGSGLIVGPREAPPVERVPLEALRRALREERRLALVYRDGEGRESRRTVWPVALAFFERVRVLVAWCELRGGFRHFRVDRIETAEEAGAMPRRRRVLLREWRTAEGIGKEMGEPGA